MKALSEDIVNEIVRILTIEMDCYLNPKTERLISVPLEASSFYKHEMWQEIIKDTKENADSFIVFHTFTSDQLFQVMQDYIAALDNKFLSEELTAAITRPHPFLRFRERLERVPDYMEQWLEFNKNAYRNYINSEYTANISKFN